MNKQRKYFRNYLTKKLKVSSSELHFIMTHNSYIIYGPEDNSGVPKESVGKYFIDCLRNRSPDDILNIDAVTKEVFTCGQLLENSIKLTEVFKTLSIKKNDIIAIVSENAINYFEPVLAALYMGVTANLLNPGYTIGELRHAFLISKPKLVICSKTSLGSVLKLREELEFIEKIVSLGPCPEDATNLDTVENLINSVTVNIESFKPDTFDYSEQGALILLSSGTTGLPKGVLITHQNLRMAAGFTSDPRFGNVTSLNTALQCLPNFHIYGVILQVSAISACMKIVLMNNFNPVLFLSSIQEHKITKLYTIPLILNFVAKSPIADAYDLSSIQDVVCASAPATEELTNEMRKRLPNAQVRQAYGLTETCGCCTMQMPNDIVPKSIGHLLPAVVAKVCDPKTNKTLGPSTTGELCFKGPMLMKRYVGNTTATTNAFDDDGFFHTGDAGFYDENYAFYIVDRIKDLIKYKGFQVSPAELEGLLMTHPQITECGVIGIPDERAGELPFAFIVLEKDSNLTEKDVRDFIAGRISVQKRLHGGVRFIEAIPKTLSGKIQRRKLLEMYQALK